MDIKLSKYARKTYARKCLLITYFLIKIQKDFAEIKNNKHVPINLNECSVSKISIRDAFFLILIKILV